MSGLHPLLERQVRKVLGSTERIPPELVPLLEAISSAYLDADEDHRMLQHAMATMSQELVDRNQLLETQLAERELLEAELLRSQKLESVGQLAAGIAHEINTPIQYVGDSLHFLQEASAALIAFANRAREAARGNGTADRQHASFEAIWHELDLDFVLGNAPAAIQRVHEGVARVSSIVDAMRSFADPSLGEKVPIDLNDAIRTILVLVGSEIHAIAEVNLRAGDVPAIRCHPSEINQVLMQLMMNAAQAIAEVQDHGRGRIDITTIPMPADVLLTVADTGPGIHPRIRDRIYDPFFTTKDVGSGTGQGLAIAHNIVVNRHGGAIWFETGQGRGTTFFVRLPVDGGAAQNGGAS